MTDITPDTTGYLTTAEYAAAQHVGVRSVKRWLASPGLEGAVKVDGRWMIPAAAPRPTASDEERAVARQVRSTLTLPALLDREPAYLTLAVAAGLLGVTEYAIRHNRATFGAVPYGDHGALLVPQATVREIAGL